MRNDVIMNKEAAMRASSVSSSSSRSSSTRSTRSTHSSSPSSTPSSSLRRRRPLLHDQEISSRGTVRVRSAPCTTRFGEVVGGTTAECAAVCCCCPCSILNLLFLTVYRLPSGLYKKAIRKKRRRKLLRDAAGLGPSVRSCTVTEPELLFRSTSSALAMVNAINSDKDVLALEEEMWTKFNSSGFLRSNSQSSDVNRG